MEIKDIIRNRRIAMNMTMKELAVKVGVSEGTISRWESGDIENMRRNMIVKLAKALDISPAVLMEWEPAPQDEYYLNKETAEIAQEVFNNHDLRVLFDAARDAKPENLRLAAEMLRRFKGGE